MDASATAYNVLRPIRVPRFDILFWLPLNLPDSFTELSIPKKATKCLGFIKPFISPISAINVIAVKRPTPGMLLSYLFSAHVAPFLELEIRSSNISLLGAFKTDSGVGYAFKMERELLQVGFENIVL